MSASRTWRTECGGYVVQFTIDSWNQIERECSGAGQIETGGILVGYYTDDESTAIVTDALPPPDDSGRGPTWFNRGVAGLRKLLVSRWRRTRRTYYIGEWHYHPASHITPSDDDLAQMRGISKDARYQCREPIMLIIGRDRRRSERPFRAFVFPGDDQYLEFLA